MQSERTGTNVKRSLFQVLWRGIVIWLVIMGAETIHGILRSAFLAPMIGDIRARQFSVLVGSLLILVLTLIFVGWIKASALHQLIVVGIMWVVLTVGFEIVLGRFVMGVTWERIASDYNIAQGGLMIFGLLIMLLAPLMMAKLRGKI